MRTVRALPQIVCPLFLSITMNSPAAVGLRYRGRPSFSCAIDSILRIRMAEYEPGIMLERIAESLPRLQARIAGYLYLLIIVGSLFASFALAPSGMMIGDAALPTTARILASRPLYVLGGAAQFIVDTCDIGVALIFYELFKTVRRNVALLATFFRLVFVAIASANMFNHFCAVNFPEWSDCWGEIESPRVRCHVPALSPARRQNALLKLQTERRRLRALFRTGMSYHVLSTEELVGTK